MSSTRRVWLFYSVVVTCAVALMIFAICCQIYIEDEGAYIYQARLICEGFLPYRDFYITQAPGVVFFFTPFVFLFGPDLTMARIVAGLTILIAFCVILELCRRTRGLKASALCALLFLCHPAYWFDASITRTQPVTIISVALTLLLIHALKERWQERLLLMGSLAWMTISRASFALCPLAISIILGITGKKRSGWIVGLGTYGVLLTGFLVFQVLADGDVPYYLVGSHLEISQRDHLTHWTRKQISLTDYAYSQGWVLIIFFASLYLSRKSKLDPLEKCALAIVALPTCIHLFAPYFYSVYQTAVLPALFFVTASRLCLWMDGREKPNWQNLGIGLLLYCLASIPIQWTQIATQWMPKNLASRRHAEVSDSLAEKIGPGGTVFTFDPGVCLKHNLKVPRGMEFGGFSFRGDFVKFPEEYCKKRNLYNSQMLQKDLQNGTIQALFVRDFPTMKSWNIEKNFQPVELWKDFGQGRDEYKLWVRKDLLRSASGSTN